MDPFSRYLPGLEEEMQRVLATPEGAPPLVYDMLRYHMGWADVDFRPARVDTGKRLRPIFLLLACESQGGAWPHALPAAAAVEFLHNFSLIHDDIEDRDRTRRGRPTLWTVWGEPQAINAGDALFALSYRAILGLQGTGVPAERVLHAIGCYTDALVRLTEGQCLDIGFESEPEIDEAVYLKMIDGKTAALIGLTCELGGVIAGADVPCVSALRAFGEALGMAFQMQDDVLGLWGDPARTGKPVGADLRRRKKSLPILHGLAHSADVRAMMQDWSGSDEQVRAALDALEAVGSRDYTLQRAGAYHESALRALERAGGQGPAQEMLRDLCERLLSRDK